MSVLDGARARPAGDAALVLEYGDTIDPALHDVVLAADRGVRAAQLPGVEETVPSYRSLLVRLDPLITTPSAVLDALAEVAALVEDRTPAHREIAVSFSAEDAPDLTLVAEALGLTPPAVISGLTGHDLRVYLHGFAPGFAYLGGVPAALHIPRRETPRPPVPPGSLLLAAGQVALCPTPMPTGWWVVGRTEASLFDTALDPPVPFVAGDVVRLTEVAS